MTPAAHLEFGLGVRGPRRPQRRHDFNARHNGNRVGMGVRSREGARGSAPPSPPKAKGFTFLNSNDRGGLWMVAKVGLSGGLCVSPFVLHARPVNMAPRQRPFKGRRNIFQLTKASFVHLHLYLVWGGAACIF